MSLNNFVLWSEGLFLRPQHFQQQDRSFRYYSNKTRAITNRNGFGLTYLSIDFELLKIGKFAINNIQGIFADQTVFDLPMDSSCPDPILIPDGCKDTIIYLALPSIKSGGQNIAYQNDSENPKFNSCKYIVSEVDTANEILNNDDIIPMQILHLNTFLILEDSLSASSLSLPVAKVVEKKSDGRVILDESFIPICLDVNASKNLIDIIIEIHGLLKHRSIALANRLVQPSTNGVAEFSDFLLLQVCNRYEPLFQYLSKLKHLHPEDLYTQMIMLAGELATFTNKNRRCPEFLEYIHTSKALSLPPVLSEIRSSLNTVIDQNAISIPLIDKGRGVYLAEIVDGRLIGSATLVLAVFANVTSEQLRGVFPAQIKIGSTDKIRDLVMSQLPGISIKALPVAPRQIPFYAGYTYFELDGSNELWTNVVVTKALAMHISGDFPGLSLELWAIRDK